MMKYLWACSSICFTWFLIFMHVLADKSYAETTSPRDTLNRALSSRCTPDMKFFSNAPGKMQVLCEENIREIFLHSRCTVSKFDACKVRMDIPSNCEGEAGRSCTLLFFFHGANGRNEDARFEKQIRGGIKEEEGSSFKGFIGIYPQGVGGWQTGCQTKFDPKVDEGAFVTAIVSILENYYGWDGLKFAVGGSNGAAQTDRMAVNSGYRFDGIVAVAGQLIKTPKISGPGIFNKNTITETTKPIPYLSLHGDADPKIPASGGTMFNNPLFELSTVADTLNEFSTLNHCSGSKADTVPIQYENIKTTAVITTFDCPKGYPVMGVMIKRARHGFWLQGWQIDGLARCPLCGQKRFSTQGNVVAHVESGACDACRGRDRAQQAVYNFVAGNTASRSLLSQQALMYNGGSSNGNSRPEYPYKCQHCPREFRMLSSMMNHMSDVHGNTNRRQTAYMSISYSS